jgi:hypothetical protein
VAVHVVQRLSSWGHDRYEVILDGQLRVFLDADALAKQASSGATVTWDVTKPRSFDFEVAQNSARS